MLTRRHHDRRDQKRDAGAYIGRLPERRDDGGPGESRRPADAEQGVPNGDVRPPGGHREAGLDRDDARHEAGERR